MYRTKPADTVRGQLRKWLRALYVASPMAYSKTNKENQPHLPAMEPLIGQTKGYVTPGSGGTWIARVYIFKHNTLRGDCYWKLMYFKKYKKRSDAEMFVSRYND